MSDCPMLSTINGTDCDLDCDLDEGHADPHVCAWESQGAHYRIEWTDPAAYISTYEAKVTK